MAVSAHVERRALEPDGEVGAMVEIYAAQGILVEP
jgi:hypothetical protein